MNKENFTRYEIARILGARSLQIAMDAPILLKLTKEEIEELNYDSLKIAEKEFNSGVLPISVKRPLPKKSEKTLKKLSKEEIQEKLEKQEEKEKQEIEKIEKEKQEIEKEEENEVMEEGEIMEMANPDDEEGEIEDKPENVEEII